MKKFLPLLLIVLFAGCKLQPIVPTGVQDVKFQAVDFMKGTVNGNLGLKIKNPNNFAVTIYSVELDVTVAGVSLGHVKLDDQFKIEKNTEAVYPVKLSATLTDIINGIPKILAAIQKKQSNVSLTGNIRAGSGIFKHTFPVNINQEKVATSQN